MRPWHRLLPGLAILVYAAPVAALVAGERHALYAEHRVFGGAAVTGNTLMSASIAAPEVNSVLLPRSAGDVRTVPFDAELQGAYLFWSGSILNRADRTVDLTAADGAFFNDIEADRCVTVPALGGFFYCRKDVTALLRDHPGPLRYNGTYFVGDVQADPGTLDANGQCINPQHCQAKYAAWSLVLVYSAASEPTLRDVFIHDGFRHLDEDQTPGIDQFDIQGFDFPEGGRASLTFFALEGDSFLGVPPQDTDPVFPCATCFDFLEFNGVKLSDALNPANNLFNSSSPGGFTLGLDLDTFDVSRHLQPGARSVRLRPGSGDGIVDVGGPGPAGGGESFFLGYVMLTVDRNAPNFRRAGTRLAVVPDEAAPEERVVFTLRLANEGTRDSPNTNLRLRLPAGLTYLPGSLRIDGRDPVPGEEVQNPLHNGFNLGNIPYRGDNDVVITFRATIDRGTPPGSRLITRGTITSDTLDMPVDTNDAVVVVLGALALDRAEKRVADLDGDGRFRPGDFVQYTILLPNPNDRAVFGVSVTDRLPPYLDVDAGRVFASSGEVEVRPEENLVTVREMVIPAGGTGQVTIFAVIHGAAELIGRDGIPPGMLNGFRIENQATVLAGGRELRTDDPGTPARDDPTAFLLSSDVDITGPQTRKTGVDVNGGFLEPGDRIRYTIQIRNEGTGPAEVIVDDPLPASLDDCRMESAHAPAICQGQGLVVMVPAGGQVAVVFSARVAVGTPHGTVIENVARVRVVGDASQEATLRSERLRVVFSPSLVETSKRVLGAPGGVALPGQRLRYEIRVPNTGNRPATDVVITDRLQFAFAQVDVQDGGVLAGNIITWRIPIIAPGETAQVAFEATLPPAVDDGTPIDNQAFVAAAELGRDEPSDDPTTGANDDPTRVVVRSEPRLVLRKDVQPRVARPGEEVVYTLVVRNEGTEDARNVQIEDRLPAVFAEIVPEGGRLAGDTVRFTPADRPALATLAVGAEVTLRVRARLQGVLRDGLRVENQATAVGDNAPPMTSDDPTTPAAGDPTAFTVSSTPALALDKSVVDLNGGDVQPGDRLRYLLTLRSTGDAPAEAVVVTDPVPAGLIDVVPGQGGALQGGRVVWQLPGEVLPGAPVALSFEATVDPATPAGAQIANQATAAATGVEPVPSDDPATPAPADPTVVTIVSRPDLSLSTKSVEPREAAPGDVVTWRIEVFNSGTAPAANVAVVDPLPADLEDVRVDQGGRVDAGTARWNLPAVGPMQRVVLTITGRIRRPLADGTTLSNQATLTADGLAAAPTDDPATPAPADPTVLVVRSAPALQVTKRVVDANGAPVRPGDELTYTITVVNTGGDTARDVVIRDAVSPNLTLVAAPGAEVQGQTLVWRLGDLGLDTPVERTFTARVAMPLANGTVIPNQAEVLGANVDPPARSDDPATPAPGDPTNVQVVSAADFSGATKSVESLDGPEFRPGGRVRYTIVLRNDGDDAARGAQVRDVLPPELTDVRAVGGAVADGVATWALGQLAPGAERTLTLEARIVFPLANGTVVSNRAEITAQGFAQPFLTDNPATPGRDATDFVVVSRPEVVLTKLVEHPGPAVRPGDVITYVIGLDNEGDAPAFGVEVVDPLPAGLQDLQVAPPAVLDGTTVRWRVDAVVPGAPQEIRVTARVPPGTPDGTRFENRARAGDLLSDDPTTPEPDATVFVVEDRADLRGSTKAVSGAFEPGGVVEYRLVVRNTGSREATGVVVRDPLPPELELIGTQPAARRVDDALVWDLGALAPGGQVQLLIRALVREEVADATVVSNQAELRWDGGPGARTDDPATPAVVDDATTFEVRARAELTVEKAVRDDDGGRFNPGDPITWLLTITNTGNRPAVGVQVVDPLDRNLVQPVAVGGEIREQGGVRTAHWTVAQIAAGASVTLELRARIADGVPDGTEITNQFGARIGNAGAFQLSPEVAFTVAADLSALRFEKTVQALQPAGFVPGGEIEYTLALTNEGATPLARVGVVDVVDLRRLGDLRPQDGGFFDGRRVEWTPERTPQLQLIAPGATVVLRIRATILPALQPGERVSNQAEAAVAGEPGTVRSDDPAVGGDADPTVFVVAGGPALSVQKVVLGPRPEDRLPGAVVTYELTVRNVGSGPSRTPVLVDRLPRPLVYVRGSTTLNGQPVAEGARPAIEAGVRLMAAGGTPGVLAPGEVAVVRFQAEIPADTPIGTRIANQGEVRDEVGTFRLSDDPDTAEIDDPTVIVVGGVPDLSRFIKSYVVLDGDGSGRAQVGQTIEWVITLRNDGNAPAEGVAITDPLHGRTRYVPGSITLDDQPLTDATDGDAGQFNRDTVSVVVGVVPPQTSRVVRFQVVVTAGPFVQNQARQRVRGGPDQLSDDGRGNGPTVVQVGEAPRREMALVKERVDGPAGGEVLAGQVVDYRLTLRNAGTVALDTLTVTDEVPVGMLFEDVFELPPGLDFRFEPPPAGRFQNGQVVIRGLALDVRSSVRMGLRLRVDPGLREDRDGICNVALATGVGVAPAESEPVCVDARVRYGRFSGVAYQDLDGNGRFEAGVDTAFTGMRVALFPAADPDGAPVTESLTDDEGRYALEELLPGTYRLRVFSATDVLLETIDGLALAPGAQVAQDLLIDPSGRVYDSVEGTPLDGMQVFIYHDLDTDDDPYDDASLAARLLVDPDDLEAASQQGQRTAHGGLYKFAVKRPGRYLVEVVPEGQTWVSPSVLVPPVPGYAFTDDPEGRVVESSLPSVEPNADRTYFLAFELRDAGDLFTNNHIPVDPLSALIDIDKRSARPTATVGDIVTYQIDVTNRSPQDLLYDPSRQVGGVYIQDVLPDGFKYIARSAVLVRVRNGREIPLSGDDAPRTDQLGARILRFGRIVQQEGRQVQIPLDLHAGESLRLRYQAVVGVKAKPKRKYTNRVVLLADNTPVSRVAEAAVLVVADPDFDQGLLLGKVWCDANGNGWQDEGEPGLGGARIYLDTGWYAVTDSAGKFHFKDIDPGTHAAKIDRDTLLPGAELTTDETRVVHFTRGLPAKIGFGVTCPTETVTGARLELGEDGLSAALEALRRRFVVIAGNVNALQVRVGEDVEQAPVIAVGLLVGGTPQDKPDLTPRAGGVTEELAFRTRLGEGVQASRWALWIGPVGGDEAMVATGTGAPPEVIPWDQRDPEGKALLSRGKAYTYRLEVGSADGGLVGSPAGVFGVGYNAPEEPDLVAAFKADGFVRGQPGRVHRKALDDLAPRLKALPGTLLVVVHTDDAPGDAEAKAETEKQAVALKRYLVEKHQIPTDRVEAVGAGNTRPLVPNISERNRERNRRVEIRHRSADARQVKATVDVEPAFPAVARAGERSVVPEPNGEFAITAEVPEDGVVEVYLRATDGRRAVFPLPVRAGTPPRRGAPREVVVEGTAPDQLTVGGVKVEPRGLGVRVEGPAEVGLDGGRLAAPVTFRPQVGDAVVHWRLVVLGPDQRPVFTARGDGAPPPEVVWREADRPLQPGVYPYRLTVRTRDLAVGQSSAAAVRVGPLTGGLPGVAEGAPAGGAWQLYLDGQPLRPDPGGRFYAPVTVRGDEAILFELVRPDGGSAVFFVRPPPPPKAEDDAAAPAPVAPREVSPREIALDGPPVGGGSFVDPTAAGGAGYRKLGPEGQPLPAAAAAAQPLPARPQVNAPRALPPPERARIEAFGRAELSRVLAPLIEQGDGADVAARTLSVELPPAGAEIAGQTLPVRGTTAPGNRIYLNGLEIPVDGEGAFAGAAPVVPGMTELEILAVDPAGNRGVIRHPVSVKDAGWFLLAMGEGTTGFAGSELDGVEPHTSTRVGDSIYLHGRATAYFKGYMRGEDFLGGIFSRYEATAHVDTARREEFEAYFRQLIDPETFYPTYGDSAEEVKDVNTRGPLYVLIKADDSRIIVGNFKTAIRGIELLNYDRALYGAGVQLDKTTGEFKHELKAFVADQDRPEQHVYVELRATGGSLYYLPNRDLVEGSERVFLVERDRVTGIERRRVPMSRDLDYTIRYDDGRILLKSPVPSVSLATFGALPQPGDRADVLDGHPVFLSVEYDHQDLDAQGNTAFGVHARETWNGAISVGGGYIEEGRGDGGVPDYKLWGADLQLRHKRRSRLEGEIARSESVNGRNLFSEDGGLTFRPFNLRDGQSAEGTALLLRGGFELDDFIGEGTRDHWYSEGYWQYIGPGYYAGGTIQQQGLEKYGGLSRYWFDAHHSVRIQHDGIRAEEPETQAFGVFTAYRREVTRAGYTYTDGPLVVDAEFIHTQSDEGLTAEEGGIFVTDALSLGAQYRINDRWSILGEQEVIVRGDSRIHDSTADLFTSTVGARYQLTEKLQIELTETVRWNGDNATQLGARTQLDERHTAYVQQRVAQTQQTGVTSTSVVGGEERWGPDRSGRAYGEYQLEAGELGARNRAVLGLGKRTKLTRELTIDAAYERNQVTGGLTGEFSQDTVSLGVEWLDSDFLKVAGRYELRYEDNDEDFDQRDRVQFLTLNGISLKLHRDVTMLLRGNYSHTLDLVFDASEAELLELSLGFAYRPVAFDWVTVLAKYTKRFEQRPIDVSVEQPEREESDVVSVIPIFELPWHFQLVEKVAYKRTALRIAQIPTVVSHTVLWINRLNFHLTDTWDIGGEYRFLHNTLSQDLMHGALFEVNYIIQKKVRLGAGYNFTSFSDDEFARLDEDHGGPFFRVIAHY